MPPIAPSSQGSRAGLITALVVFVILFVTTTILTFNYYSKWDAETKKGTDYQNTMKTFVTPADQALPEVTDLKAQAGQHPGATVLSMAIQQRDELAKDLTGAANLSMEVVRKMNADSLEQIRHDLKSSNVTAVLSEDNAIGNMKVLNEQVRTQSAALAQAQSDLKAANDKATAAINERQALLAEKDKQIAEEQKKATDAMAGAKTREDAIGANVAGIEKSSSDALAAANQQVAAAQAELSKLQGLYKKLQDDYNKAIAQLNNYRMNPSRALLRPAGVITRVPGNNIVFINLGEQDQVFPGLTFEVYDKIKGLPSLTAFNPDDKDALLPGKASIEVIRVVGPASECRVVQKAQGQTIVEGDLILNLIFNTHTRFVFDIYGDFDLAGNGQANVADADILRRLVTQWGGRVTDQINVDTDFLVLGKEPVAPPASDNPSPLENERREKALKAADDYHAVEAAAQRLNIPILNQNRFLYFVGYYDQARR